MSVFRRVMGGVGRKPAAPVKGLFDTEWGERPPWMKHGLRVALVEGDEPLEVVGESHHQGELRKILSGLGREVQALLVPEPDNPYDRNAVAVWVGGLQVGHLKRSDAAAYQAGVVSLMTKTGQPVALLGGIVGGDRDRPSLGIWLRHDPVEFGVDGPPIDERSRSRERDRGGVRTGSVAASDGLTWIDQMPRDRIAAIKYLRDVLGDEEDSVQRHFAYLELEARLYKARDVFESALAEFEQTCLAHDSEMDAIIPLLRESLGGVPALPTYKQAAIMKQKAHDWEAAIWWAERGLFWYGDDGLRVDAVQDLRDRLIKYRRNIDHP